MEKTSKEFFRESYPLKFWPHSELSSLDGDDHIQFERNFEKLEFLEYAYLCFSSIFSALCEKQGSVQEVENHDLHDRIGA